MAEPMTTTTTGLVAWFSSLSAVTLALVGVDYYALVWGLVGAMFARGHADEMKSRWRAVFYIVLSTCVGAAIGTGMQALLAEASRPVLIVFSLAGAAGAQRLLDALVSMLERRIEAVAGLTKGSVK